LEKKSIDCSDIYVSDFFPPHLGSVIACQHYEQNCYCSFKHEVDVHNKHLYTEATHLLNIIVEKYNILDGS